MYETFYGFSEKPFSLLPDPAFLYMGHKHSVAFSMLEHGLENQNGFTVLTGEIGSGKTTLIRHLLNQIGEEIVVGLLSNTQLGVEELLQWVLLSFDQDYQSRSKVELFDNFTRFLIDQYAHNRRVVLIIDEAQNLQPEVLEELRMLSNINADKDQLLQLILLGQPQLRDTLRMPELLQFSQRISVNYHIQALNRKETENYILHRLKCAGRSQELFTRDAVDMIFRAGKGIPRAINVICDTALVYGFADQKQVLDATVIADVVRDKADSNLVYSEEASLPEPAPVLKYKPDPDRNTESVFDRDMARQLFSKLRDR